MKQRDLEQLLGTDFLNENGLTFLDYSKGNETSATKVTLKYESLEFSIRNEIKHKHAKTLQCEFKSYSGNPGIYLDICWYQPPCCRMVCFSERIAENYNQLPDKKETISAAIEHSLSVIKRFYTEKT